MFLLQFKDNWWPIEVMIPPLGYLGTLPQAELDYIDYVYIVKIYEGSGGGDDDGDGEVKKRRFRGRFLGTVGKGRQRGRASEQGDP